MNDRPGFGLNFDPSHFIWQDLDPVMFLQDFAPFTFHVHVKESARQLNGRNGPLGSRLPWGDPHRGWDVVTAGHGDVPGTAFDAAFSARSASTQETSDHAITKEGS